jgi:hypothetical protein
MAHNKTEHKEIKTENQREKEEKPNRRWREKENKHQRRRYEQKPWKTPSHQKPAVRSKKWRMSLALCD